MPGSKPPSGQYAKMAEKVLRRSLSDKISYDKNDPVVKAFSKYVGKPAYILNSTEPWDTIWGNKNWKNAFLRTTYENGNLYLTKHNHVKKGLLSYHPNTKEENEKVLVLFLGLVTSKPYKGSNTKYGITMLWNNQTYISISHPKEDLRRYIEFLDDGDWPVEIFGL